MQLSLFEIIFRVIPEGILFFYCIGLITGKNIKKVPLLVSITMFTVAVSVTRSLPIIMGVHTIISLLSIISILVFYLKFKFIESLKSTLIVVVMQFLSEGIMVILLVLIFKDIHSIFANPIIKTLAGLPTFLILYFQVVLYKRKLECKGELLKG